MYTINFKMVVYVCAHYMYNTTCTCIGAHPMLILKSLIMIGFWLIKGLFNSHSNRQILPSEKIERCSLLMTGGRAWEQIATSREHHIDSKSLKIVQFQINKFLFGVKGLGKCRRTIRILIKIGASRQLISTFRIDDQRAQGIRAAHRKSVHLLLGDARIAINFVGISFSRAKGVLYKIKANAGIVPRR